MKIAVAVSLRLRFAAVKTIRAAVKKPAAAVLKKNDHIFNNDIERIFHQKTNFMGYKTLLLPCMIGKRRVLYGKRFFHGIVLYHNGSIFFHHSDIGAFGKISSKFAQYQKNPFFVLVMFWKKA